RDGRKIDVTLTVTPIKNRCGEVTGLLSIAKDTREIKLAEETIQRLRKGEQNRQILMETVSDVSLGIPGNEALYRIADAARTLAKARYAALAVVRSDADGLMEFVTVGMTPDEEARLGARPQGAGVLGLLLHRTEPLRISNLGDHPASVGFPPHHPPMTSFLGVPIHRGEVVVGSLYLTNKIGGGDFTEEDEIAVQSLGAHAAMAIQNLHMHSRQRALVSGLIMAQEEERRAIAYDLHDGLTQYVMASHAHLESFRHAHETGKTERAQREMDQALQYLKEAVVESRRLVSGLRSLALDDLGLSAAIEQLLNEEKAHASWEEADLIHNMEGRRFDKALETAVYRVAQEALTNARKHAGARQIRLLLQTETDAQEAAVRIILEVRDWGQGFDPDRYPRDFTHVGLQGMAERVNLMGGTFEIQSKPGGGTLVRAIFPAVEPPA
nr:GAF domain-containing sensor histidine kinase [Armatimonadota bacterium]